MPFEVAKTVFSRAVRRFVWLSEDLGTTCASFYAMLIDAFRTAECAQRVFETGDPCLGSFVVDELGIRHTREAERCCKSTQWRLRASKNCEVDLHLLTGRRLEAHECVYVTPGAEIDVAGLVFRENS